MVPMDLKSLKLSLLSYLRQRCVGIVPILALMVLVAWALSMLSAATLDSVSFREIYLELIVLNGVLLIVLIALIGMNGLHLLRQYRAEAPGSRLTAQLVVIFVVLSTAPAAMVFYFSIQFINRGTDRLFHGPMEQTLNDALLLSQRAFDGNIKTKLKMTEQLANALFMEMNPEETEALEHPLDSLREQSNAVELTVQAPNGSVIAFSSIDPTSIVPYLPEEGILQQVRKGHPYAAVDKIRSEALHIRIVIALDPQATRGSPTLQAIYALPESLDTLATAVEAGIVHYKQLNYYREPLKKSYSGTLLLVLLLSLLMAIWGAFFSARRLILPISNLTDGTKAIADGDYSKRLPTPGFDELGHLFNSFNEMTACLEQARNSAYQSQQQVEDQKAYLETVLRRLSSGVMTVNMAQKLYTLNHAANSILEIDLEPWLQHSIATISQHFPLQDVFFQQIQARLQTIDQEWRQEITLLFNPKRKVLICKGTPLHGADGKQVGHVILFDDITALIQAQRDAAWGEVARRLAHEIKNPLTPIQLSAERLRHKYLAKMSAEDAKVLDRSTHTIIQQVEAMKEMVNAFSDYARAPNLNITELDLNRLVSETLDLYKNNAQHTVIHCDLEPQLPLIHADTGRIRQLLHNLIKNALEALNQTADATLTVTTHGGDTASAPVTLIFRDNGAGFPDNMADRLFEPYVTTKPKGTGLGLAIVKKIVEEHNGTICLHNHPQGGAEIRIDWPLGRTDPPHPSNNPS